MKRSVDDTITIAYKRLNAQSHIDPILKILYYAFSAVGNALSRAADGDIMSTMLHDNSPVASHIRQPRGAIWRWLLYCWGVCLELLGVAFMGAVIVMFFGQVDARALLALTAGGMVLFYSGWFCVRHASRGAAKASQERG